MGSLQCSLQFDSHCHMKYLLLLSLQINMFFMCSGVLCVVGQQGSSSAGDQGCLGCLSGPQVQPDPQDTQQTLQGLLFWVRTDTSTAHIHSHTPFTYVYPHYHVTNADLYPNNKNPHCNNS